MTKPVTIPNTFATATTAIPLSQLDSDFSTVATALNDANTYSNYAADTGVANAYVVTLTGVSTTYSAGLRIQFKAGASNTGASTLNVNGGGTKNITFQDASALSSGTIAANAIVDVMYDGTQFLLMNDPAGATGGDVVGPASATDNAIVRFDGATGKLVQNSVVTIADSTGDVAGVGALTASGNVTLSGGTANGVLYLNGSKVATSGSALTFDGTNLGVSGPIKLTATSTAPSANNEFVAYSTNGYTYLSGGTNGLIISNNSGADTRIRLEDANNIQFEVSSAEQMRLTSTGLKSSIAGTNADPAFSYTSDTNTGIFFPAADKLGFTAGGGTDDMVLTTTGLGIGTSSPSNYSSAAYNLVIAGTGQRGMTISSTDSNQCSIFFANSTVGAAQYAGYLAYFHSNNSLAFGTNSTERMRLDSSGNLGLGVTPSAWGSNFRSAIQGPYGNYALYADQSNYARFGLASNAFHNGTAFTYVNSSPAAQYQQFDGVHKWYTAPSGTAGNAITFTQALTLNTNGALVLQGGDTAASGVGVTFPATQSASSNANTLDDYEEGTWTPTTVVNGFTQSISTLTGSYTKTGNVVVVCMRVVLSASGYPSSYSQFSGLPFTVKTGFDGSGCFNGSNVGSGNQLGNALAGNASTNVFWSSITVGTTSSTDWFATITYLV